MKWKRIIIYLALPLFNMGLFYVFSLNSQKNFNRQMNDSIASLATKLENTKMPADQIKAIDNSLLDIKHSISGFVTNIAFVLFIVIFFSAIPIVTDSLFQRIKATRKNVVQE